MAATLLGGITVDATPGGIAVGDDLYAVNSAVRNLYRYALPGLVNTEGTSPWSSSASGGFLTSGVTTDIAGGRVFVVEIDTSPATTRIYEVNTATSFPATKTQLVTTAGLLGIRIAYNPVTDSIWLIGDDVWDVPASGGSFTAIDTTFTGIIQGPPSVSPSGDVWGTFLISGTTLVIYRWEPDGTRHTVLSEGGVSYSPGPGLALADGTFLFVYDFGSGEEWATITSAGTITPTSELNGPDGPYPTLLHRMYRVGNTGYMVQDAGESGLTNDIYTFPAGAAAIARWRIGRIGWPT